MRTRFLGQGSGASNGFWDSCSGGDFWDSSEFGFGGEVEVLEDLFGGEYVVLEDPFGGECVVLKVPFGGELVVSGEVL